MARISKYTQDTTVESTDQLIGSNANGVTKNFSVDSLNTYFANNAGVKKHHQNNADDEWTIAHNLDLEHYLPHVTVKMSTGVVYPNVQGMGMVTYVDKDNLKINFLGEESGYAYIKK